MHPATSLAFYHQLEQLIPALLSAFVPMQDLRAGLKTVKLSAIW
jgi:hypothetical protein